MRPEGKAGPGTFLWSPPTEASRREVTHAGTASTTASTLSDDPPVMESRQPRVAGARPVTPWARRSRCPSFVTSASTTSAIPEAKLLKPRLSWDAAVV